MRIAFAWNGERNRQLIEERGISFEVIVVAIGRGDLVDLVEHPNQERYPGQMVHAVEVGNYLYLVPFVLESDGTRFLKMIIPSRKATRDYGRR